MTDARMAIPLQMIRSYSELGTLPLRSIVREQMHQGRLSGDRNCVWERRRSGWHQISGLVADSEADKPAVPAVVLWHPKWHELLG